MNELQAKLVDMVDTMPAFPSSVTKILQLTSDINSSPKALIEVIDHDPVMTIKILILVNSAYFGLSKKIISIKQGVVILGINTLKNLAVTIAAMGMLPQNSNSKFDSNQFLLHSLGTATIARLLGQKLQVSAKEASDYFVAGLLHDFGKVVLVQFMPEEMEKALTRAANEGIPLFQTEAEEIRSDHTELGGMLAEKWQLPEDLVISLREHHKPITTGDTAKMRDCVIAANSIIKCLEFGHSGNPLIARLPDVVIERFGMELDELLESLGDVSEDLEKTRIFATL
ncbi:hypothetical protein MNBD_GAMMA16-1918 [hydrothermal vent metagenome]|uniref:HDOD domain-containing protein n=1 Tax=hydrothermal vent metagenome TaxID=652676 RepID=A0A3B0YWT5_9ZZZZ